MKKIESDICKYLTSETRWLLVDYYDTLVTRDCNPEDIKILWANVLANYIEYKISGTELLAIRKASERKLSEKYSGLLSVSYDYRQLANEIFYRLCYSSKNTLLNIWKNKEQFYKYSLDLEVSIEKRHQKIIKDNYSAIEKMKKSGIKVAVVSDFYIGLEGFYQYAPFEIVNLVDRIFISCDCGDRKENGKLYDYILKELEISSTETLMIGDNKNSDYLIPLRKGIKSIYLQNTKKIRETTIAVQESRLWDIMKANKDILYGNYAFALYYFIDQMYRYVRKNGIDKVLFCAREGEFLKELFEVYLNNHPACGVKCEYLYVSRLSTFVPSLKKLEDEKFENLFRQFKDISPRSFMISIGFDNQDAIQICIENGIEPESIVYNFPESECWIKLKADQFFCEKYQEVTNSQKRGFDAYINSIICSEEDMCIIDVGWKGTIQDNIYGFFGNRRKIIGIYLGLSENLDKNDNNVKVGINFSTFPTVSDNYDIWSYDKSFYEKLLYASHASTTRYQLNGEPILEEFSHEKDTFEYIRPIQLGILRIFEEIDKLMICGCWNAEDMKRIFTKIHLYTICHIDYKHIKIQERLINDHFQNFGEFSWSQKKIIDQIGQIFKLDRVGITKKIFKEGLEIKYMYPGTKVINKMKMKRLLPFYYKMVYNHMKRKLN